MKHCDLSLLTVWCYDLSQILLIVPDPACVFIFDQYSQRTEVWPRPPAPFDYWHIGLSDCFERSLQIQISFNTSISIILPQIFRKYLYGNKNIANRTSCLYKRIVANSNVLLLLKGKLGISDFVVVLRVR